MVDQGVELAVRKKGAMPKRKYYGYYRGRRQWRGSRAYAMRMIVTPIAIVLLLLIAWIVTQPILILIVLIGAAGVFLIVKWYRGNTAIPSVPTHLACGHEYKVENVYLGMDGNRNCRICLKERSVLKERSINYPKLSGNSTHREDYRDKYE